MSDSGSFTEDVKMDDDELDEDDELEDEEEEEEDEVVIMVDLWNTLYLGGHCEDQVLVE